MTTVVTKPARSGDVGDRVATAILSRLQMLGRALQPLSDAR